MYPASYCPCEGFNSSVHGAVLKYGFEHDPHGQSGLIYTYAGLGGLGCCHWMFSSIGKPDSVYQTAMISACAKTGDFAFARSQTLLECDASQNGEQVSQITSLQQFIPHDLDVDSIGDELWPIIAKSLTLVALLAKVELYHLGQRTVLLRFLWGAAKLKTAEEQRVQWRHQIDLILSNISFLIHISPLVIMYEPLESDSRDQEGRLVRIENPQDTELDICVNIMDPPPEDQNSQQGQGAPYCAPLPNFHGMESENPYLTSRSLRRYMEAINACPHHGFDTWLLVSYFYDGMSSSMKQILETMCGGDFMSKNPEEAMDFLSYVAEVSRGWDEPNSREKGKFPSQQTQNPKAGMYMLSEDVDKS
ncbi:putative pentatricopeptide repeat-containing protein [Vitis vinifera]|uniref:Putative pentatricopeptide repeat-containing protein n=1 Tax=Vitis vinifera TaxID=29760 RepID=A0A438CKP2_VITVI|nr:putative pentatricopeptide repeat-containing protein [Vitis vinifera]